MEKAGASSACLSQCDMMELCTDLAPKGERLNEIEDQLLTMKPGVKMEGFRAPASSGLSKTSGISSHLRILYKLPSQRLAKLGTFARLHKATPGKIFVECAHRNRRNRIGGASRWVRGWVGGRKQESIPGPWSYSHRRTSSVSMQMACSS